MSGYSVFALRRFQDHRNGISHRAGFLARTFDQSFFETFGERQKRMCASGSLVRIRFRFESNLSVGNSREGQGREPLDRGHWID